MVGRREESLVQQYTVTGRRGCSDERRRQQLQRADHGTTVKAEADHPFELSCQKCVKGKERSNENVRGVAASW